ncbi:hypothetical protein O6H91_04G086300 [Diphasiastrum complanatum]|uniref:Uncharacterized protein n=1 Tax=Diphasiastrum complanatum TaxID=34168 RepID=A0ACC2DYZ6_DIPCM|nr:hypothetical protein O6H91_04G086300 [Diphasiastrum complanatum]
MERNFVMMRMMVMVVMMATLMRYPSSVVRCADPDPLEDFAAASFALRNIFANATVTKSDGGVRAVVGPKHLRVQSHQGVSIARYLIEPCGLDPPQTHPRATELITLLAGGPLLVGFVDSSIGQLRSNVLQANDVAVFPRGLLHFMQNVGNTTASIFSVFNSESPGVLVSSVGLFRLPEEVVAGAMNQSPKVVKHINKTMYNAGPSLIMISQESGCVPGRTYPK